MRQPQMIFPDREGITQLAIFREKKHRPFNDIVRNLQDIQTNLNSILIYIENKVLLNYVLFSAGLKNISSACRMTQS
jgi:hypothetical protein